VQIGAAYLARNGAGLGFASRRSRQHSRGPKVTSIQGISIGNPGSVAIYQRPVTRTKFASRVPVRYRVPGAAVAAQNAIREPRSKSLGLAGNETPPDCNVSKDDEATIPIKCDAGHYDAIPTGEAKDLMKTFASSDPSPLNQCLDTGEKRSLTRAVKRDYSTARPGLAASRASSKGAQAKPSHN